MNRRELLLGMAGAPLLTGCLWPRFFDLGWDEEVRLTDGRVIVVKLKYTYERLSQATLNQYDRAILRNTTLSFDAGPPNGVVTQLFMGVRPALLDQRYGKWYMVLNGGNYTYSTNNAGQDWGPGQNFVEQRVAELVSGTFSPISIKQLPAELTVPNLLLQYAPVQELASFDGQRLTLVKKGEYLQRYPLGPGDRRIERPQEPAKTNSRSQQ